MIACFETIKGDVMKAYGYLWLKNGFEIDLCGQELTPEQRLQLTNNDIESIGEHEIGHEANVSFEDRFEAERCKLAIKTFLLK